MVLKYFCFSFLKKNVFFYGNFVFKKINLFLYNFFFYFYAIKKFFRINISRLQNKKVFNILKSPIRYKLSKHQLVIKRLTYQITMKLTDNSKIKYVKYSTLTVKYYLILTNIFLTYSTYFWKINFFKKRLNCYFNFKMSIFYIKLYLPLLPITLSYIYILIINLKFNFYQNFIRFFKADKLLKFYTNNLNSTINSFFLKNFFYTFVIWSLIFNDYTITFKNYNCFYYYLFVYYIFVYLYICILNETYTYKRLHYESSYSYTLLFVVPPIIFFFENIYFLFFLLEFLLLLVFLNFLNNYYGSIFWKKKYFFLNKQYMVILLYNIFLNFLSSVLFFWSLIFLVNYTNSVNLDFLKIIFIILDNGSYNYIFLNHQNVKFYLAVLLFSIFVKLGVGPFIFLKFHIYKYLTINTIFFYSSIYIYIIYLFFINKFFFLISLFFGYYIYIFLINFILLLLLIFFKIQNILSVKYFLALSSFINTMVIINFFLVLNF